MAFRVIISLQKVSLQKVKAHVFLSMANEFKSILSVIPFSNLHQS